MAELFASLRVSPINNHTAIPSMRDCSGRGARQAGRRMCLAIPFIALLGRTLGLSRSLQCLIALVCGVAGVFGVEGAEVTLEPPVIAQYLRDADGQRVGKILVRWDTLEERWKTNIHRFLIDTEHPSGYAQRVGERGEGEEDTRAELHGLQWIGDVSSDQVQYAVSDGHGSVRGSVGERGSLQCTVVYDAFGIGMGECDHQKEEVPGYVGEIWDPSTGLQDLRARHYDSGCGRFLTMDPYEGDNRLPAAFLKYGYCRANPINRTDSSGFSDSGALAEQLSVVGVQALLASTLLYAGLTLSRQAGPLPTLDFVSAQETGLAQEQPAPAGQPQPAPRPVVPPLGIELDEESIDTVTVHRMGSRANIRLGERERQLRPSGFSVLMGGTAVDAALQIRRAFSPRSRFSLIWDTSRTVSSAQRSSIRTLGFDVIADPSRKLPNHGRVVHATGGPEAFDNPVLLRMLSELFYETSVPIP